MIGEDMMAKSPKATNLSRRLSGDNLDQLMDGKWCDPAILSELPEAFTPELAHTAYIPLCRLTGSIHMESKLYNHEMVWKLSSTHEKELAAQAAALAQQAAAANRDNPSLRQTSWFVDIGASVPAAKIEDDDPLHVVSGEFGRNVAIVGNRIDISGFSDSESSDEDEGDGGALTRQRLKSFTGKRHVEKKVNLSAEMGKSARQLKGTWLSYWEQFTAKGELDDVFQFTQLKLQTFVGHTGAIRALCTMGNLNSFVSSSKDKMVKLWSLRNHGDGTYRSQCRYTYPYHRKAVFAATFLEAPRLVATCDGVVHMKSCSNNTFITTSVDHSITMWKEDGSRICSFRGANEPVHCLQISNGQIVSATTANRIGIHSTLDQNAGYYSTRLRSDVFKGVISTMEVLPNKQLLLGSDNGNIVLLA